jgi:hypothetical protein
MQSVWMQKRTSVGMEHISSGGKGLILGRPSIVRSVSCRRERAGDWRERERNGEYTACEYSEVMLPSIFMLHQQQHLAQIVKAVGFQGEYNSEDLGEWLNNTAEGFGQEWESNWIET